MTILRFSGDTIVGLSSDTKPMNVIDGSRFFEADTPEIYIKRDGVWVPMFPREAVQALAGSAPEFNLDLGRGATITLSANTVITFSHLQANDTGHIKVTQAGGGGYKLDFAGATIHIAANSYENVGRVKLTYTGGSKDIVAYWYDGYVVNLAVIYNVQ